MDISELINIGSLLLVGVCLNTLIRELFAARRSAQDNQTDKLVPLITQAMAYLVADRNCARDPLNGRIMTSGLARAINVPGSPLWAGSPAVRPEPMSEPDENPSNEDLASLREVTRGDQRFETVGP